MKSNAQFKTMRHIEAVRNFLSAVIKELMDRQVNHDQSKLQEPELSVFNEHTHKLRGITYGSAEYKESMAKMKPAIDHHTSVNRHHPEHFMKEDRYILNEVSAIGCMNLIDLIEMICDWKAATLRHGDGDIYKSLEINAKRFGYPKEIYCIFKNTINWIEKQPVNHHANES